MTCTANIWLHVTSSACEGRKAKCRRIPLMCAPSKTCVLLWITTERRPNGPLCRNLRSPKGERKTICKLMSSSWNNYHTCICVLRNTVPPDSSCIRGTSGGVKQGWTPDGSDEFMSFNSGHWKVLHYPLGITALWTNRAGCLWGADWAGRWSINYDEKAARLTPLHLRLICSQGEILFSLQDQGKKTAGESFC